MASLAALTIGDAIALAVGVPGFIMFSFAIVDRVRGRATFDTATKDTVARLSGEVEGIKQILNAHDGEAAIAISERARVSEKLQTIERECEEFREVRDAFIGFSAANAVSHGVTEKALIRIETSVRSLQRQLGDLATRGPLPEFSRTAQAG